MSNEGLPAPLRALDRGLDILSRVFGIAATLVIAYLAAVISAEVVARNLGLPAFGWSLEIAEYGLLVVSFLGAPWVLRHHGHISVDVVLRHVSERAAARLLAIADLVSAAVCALLAYYAALAAIDAFTKGSMIYKYLVLPQWIILAILPVGMTLLTLEFLLRLARRASGGSADTKASHAP